MASFSETHAITTKNYVVEIDLLMPTSSRAFQLFWSHCFVFALEKQSEKLDFQSFLPLIEQGNPTPN